MTLSQQRYRGWVGVGGHIHRVKVKPHWNCSHTKIGILHIPSCEVSNCRPFKVTAKMPQAIYHLLAGFNLFYESEMNEPRFYL